MSFSINLELNNKTNSDGRKSIMFRVTKNRKSARYTTSFAIDPKDFNKKAKFGKWIRTSNPFHSKLNLNLTQRYNEIQFFAENLLQESPLLSASNVIERYKADKNSKELPTSWLSYFDKLVDHYHSINKQRYAIRINAIRNKLSDFLEGKPLDLNETTVELANKFEAYLYSIGNSANTTNGNLKVLKQVYRRAIDDNLIANPDLQFLKHSVKTKHVERDKLTVDEIKALENLEAPEYSWVWNARNYFLFAFYMGGIRFGDFIELQWKNIVDGNLRYLMNKTGKQQRLSIHPQAFKILEFYRTDKSEPEDFIFPLLPKNFFDLDPVKQIQLSGAKNTLVNKNLKLVARKAGIEKKLSFHIARHSFAYIAFKKIKDPLAIQNVLQHSKLKETQDYITSLANEEERDILGEIFN